MEKNEFRGWSLFNDIDDINLRNRNRAVVLSNIAEDCTRNRLISPRGASLILQYFKLIPDAEKIDVRNRFAQNMKEKGYVLTAGT